MRSIADSPEAAYLGSAHCAKYPTVRCSTFRPFEVV